MSNVFASADDRRVLSVGLACLDIVMYCSSYPEEDSDQRCISHEWARGGNASNICTVMTELRVPCEYLGTMSLDYGGKFLKHHFEEHGINIENCIFHESCSCPTSVILISAINGSRTIVHSNKNLPELTFDDFKALDLSKYKWIHFEVRPSAEEIKKMIDHIRKWNSKEDHCRGITVSLEIEKPKLHLTDLLGYGDFVFISKDFARACGYDCMRSAAEALSNKLLNGSTIFCLWGEDGACAQPKGGELVVAPAFSPEKVIDTLGAGDTFVATAIACLAAKWDLEHALSCACHVAGVKCGIQGFKQLQRSCPIFTKK